MKISYNWLGTYLDTNLPPAEVGEILTDIGLEVEKIEHFESVAGGLKGVVVGRVEEVWAHPNADKLKVTRVDVGTGEKLTIVCGAPNVAAGQKVLVATVGTVLMADSEKPLEIKRAKIRGEESMGMICAEDELGIGTSHEGIMVLPEETPVGTPAADFLGMEEDHVFEIGLTPNRTDAMGHFGVARDLAARFSLERKTRAKLPEFTNLSFAGPLNVKVEVQDSDGCGKYMGLVIKNLEVAPSPAWLQNRLRAIGLSPVNNVVDVTNFVLHETGQPLHAFDLDKIKGNKIVVKSLPEGTLFTTLDGRERKLSSEDLMICDVEEGHCIAGTLGGEKSGVNTTTQNIFLESAWFNPSRVRKTAKRHALNTDASFRFERGVDPEGAEYALRRAALLITSLAGGDIYGPPAEITPGVPEKAHVELKLSRLNQLCGTNLSSEELENILDSLDFEISQKKEGTYKLIVPSYRVDVTREADVIEEVLRIYGYNAVPIPDRMSLSVSIPEKPETAAVVQSLSQLLMGRGFSEMMSNGLTRSDYILKAGGEELKDQLVYMLNPLSMELDVLRPSLAVSAMEVAAYNLNRQVERLKLFEMGTAYKKLEKGYDETFTLCILLSGSRFPENWNNPGDEMGMGDVREVVNEIFSVLGLSGLTNYEVKHPFLTHSQAVKLGKKNLAVFGQVNEKAARIYGVKKKLWLAEINLGMAVAAIKSNSLQLKELPKFPWVRRDLSLLLDRSVRFQDIEEIAFRTAGGLLKEVGLFDVYEGKNLPENKKSYAIRFILQDENKTLTDKRIDLTMQKIQKAFEDIHGAELR